METQGKNIAEVCNIGRTEKKEEHRPAAVKAGNKLLPNN